MGRKGLAWAWTQKKRGLEAGVWRTGRNRLQLALAGRKASPTHTAAGLLASGQLAAGAMP